MSPFLSPLISLCTRAEWPWWPSESSLLLAFSCTCIKYLAFCLGALLCTHVYECVCVCVCVFVCVCVCVCVRVCVFLSCPPALLDVPVFPGGCLHTVRDS